MFIRIESRPWDITSDGGIEWTIYTETSGEKYLVKRVIPLDYYSDKSMFRRVIDSMAVDLQEIIVEKMNKLEKSNPS